MAQLLQPLLQPILKIAPSELMAICLTLAVQRSMLQRKKILALLQVVHNARSLGQVQKRRAI